MPLLIYSLVQILLKVDVRVRWQFQVLYLSLKKLTDEISCVKEKEEMGECVHDQLDHIN